MTGRPNVWAASTAVLLLPCLGGCFDAVTTPFPTGLEPWEEVNRAELPAPTADDPCPEMLVLSPGGYSANGTTVPSMHARGCIHQPLSVVWTAIQDPRSAKDPGAVNSFEVIDPPLPEECEDGVYETSLNAGDSPFTVDWHFCWRHAVVEGTDEEPLMTATKWQKVWGSTAIPTMEGSIVARPLEADPSITELAIQYHLDVVTGGELAAMEGYLGVLFTRIGDHAHGRPLTGGE